MELVKEISQITGLPSEVVELVLRANQLVLLDTVFRSVSDITKEVPDEISVGDYVVDLSDIRHPSLGVSDELYEKLLSVVKDGKDYLGGEIINKFTFDYISEILSNSMIGVD